jgi:hypothetical protein
MYLRNLFLAFKAAAIRNGAEENVNVIFHGITKRNVAAAKFGGTVHILERLDYCLHSSLGDFFIISKLGQPIERVACT